MFRKISQGLWLGIAGSLVGIISQQARIFEQALGVTPIMDFIMGAFVGTIIGDVIALATNKPTGYSRKPKAGLVRGVFAAAGGALGLHIGFEHVIVGEVVIPGGFVVGCLVGAVVGSLVS